MLQWINTRQAPLSNARYHIIQTLLACVSSLFKVDTSSSASSLIGSILASGAFACRQQWPQYYLIVFNSIYITKVLILTVCLTALLSAQGQWVDGSQPWGKATAVNVKPLSYFSLNVFVLMRHSFGFISFRVKTSASKWLCDQRLPITQSPCVHKYACC